MASRTSYEVRVAGVIGPAARKAFDDLTIRVEPSAHGLIERIKALGLELIDITRVPTGRSTSARSTRHPAE